MHKCCECGEKITSGISDFAEKFYGINLCIHHQRWIDDMQERTTEETIRLYFALKQRNVPAQLEKFDGHKHIDIAIPEAMVNIEVDGAHHNFNVNQARSDLKRTYYSFLKGYLTLRIPNSLVYDDRILEETADFIVSILVENRNKIGRKKYYY
jgi:very-short-patch-repair endonuclease